MIKSCPISNKQINKKTVRINAILTTLILILILFTKFKWLIFILTIDFFIRGFTKKPISLLTFISKNILNILKSKTIMINAEPKKFAAKIGFIFCLIISILYLFNIIIFMKIFILILLTFTSLEAFFGYCTACQIYPLIKKLL